MNSHFRDNERLHIKDGLQVIKMTAQLTTGLELLMVGMGIVFLFLALLVILSVIMSRLVMRYLPEATDVAPTRSVVGNDQKVTAAITSAVHRYRIKHKPKN